jgi:hypothetical protein
MVAGLGLLRALGFVTRFFKSKSVFRSGCMAQVRVEKGSCVKRVGDVRDGECAGSSCSNQQKRHFTSA